MAPSDDKILTGCVYIATTRKVLNGGISVLLAGQERQLSYADRLPFEVSSLGKARKEIFLDASLDSPQKVWMILLLHRSSLPHTQGDALAWVARILSSIWQNHWKCVLENISWSVEGCLSNIRNQSYGSSLARTSQALPKTKNTYWIQ